MSMMRLSCSSRFPKISLSAFSCQAQSSNSLPTNRLRYAAKHSGRIAGEIRTTCKNATSGRRDAGALLQDPQSVVLVWSSFSNWRPCFTCSNVAPWPRAWLPCRTASATAGRPRRRTSAPTQHRSNARSVSFGRGERRPAAEERLRKPIRFRLVWFRIECRISATGFCVG